MNKSLVVLGILYVVSILFVSADKGNSTKPNIVFIITDDQDWTLAQWLTVPQVKHLITDQGVTLSNYFAHTPICCPSRSQMLSGRFAHNIRDNHYEPGFGCNFPGTDCGCMRMNTSVEFHEHNFGVYLQEAGYNTGWFGKYLNWQGVKQYCSKSGSIPPGWNKAHFYCNDSYGLEGIWWNNGGQLYYTHEYSTAVMGNASVQWLAQTLQDTKEPFFMAVAPHAPHEPYTPAPWYNNSKVPDIPYPRQPWHDYHAEGKVPWLAALPPLTAQQHKNVQFMWEQRFRALMAVDDIVKEVIKLLTKYNVLDNTYVFFTSDHGHHLGEFRLTEGKEHPYEFDVRVPFAVRGPGVPANKTLPILTSNVDLGPTFIELAGGKVPPQMDGQSFAQYLKNPSWAEDGAKKNVAAPTWNREALPIEYYSVANWPANYKEGVTSFNDCPNNTYRALRFMDSDFGNLLYVEYTTVSDWWFQHINFYELYDLAKDPYQLTNIYPKTTDSLKARLHDLMLTSYACGGGFAKQSNCTAPFPPKSTHITSHALISM